MIMCDGIYTPFPLGDHEAMVHELLIDINKSFHVIFPTIVDHQPPLPLVHFRDTFWRSDVSDGETIRDVDEALRQELDALNEKP